MSFRQLLADRKTAALAPSDPWRPVLEKLSGTIGLSKVERIPTDRIFDALNLTKAERTPEAAKRLKEAMTSLGWVPVRATHITSRGRAARVRGYARQARNQHAAS